MATPKNIKQAFENGYIFKSGYDKGGKQIRVDLKPRFFDRVQKPLLSFWIDRNYFKRTYPNLYSCHF